MAFDFIEKMDETDLLIGKTLRPKSGTLIHGLRTTLGPVAEVSSLPLKAVEGNSTFGIYDTMADDAVRSLSRITARISETAKEVVNPLVKDVLTAFNNAEVELASLPTVRQIAPKTALITDSIKDIVEMYRGQVLTELTNDLKMDLIDFINGMTPETIKEAMGWNSAFEEVWALVNTDEGLVSCLVSGVKNLYDKRIDLRYFGDVGNLVALVLLAEGALKGGALGEVSSDVDVRHALGELKMKAAHYLGLYLRNEEAVFTDATIVLPEWFTGKRGNTIFVHERVYRNWVKVDGGSPEAMIGYAGTSLIENRENLADLELCLKAYESLRRKMEEVRNVSKVRTALNATRKILMDYIYTHYSDDTEKRNHYTSKLSRNLTEITYDHHGVKRYALKMICKTLLEGDDVYKFLKNVQVNLEEQAIHKAKEDVCMKEATHMAYLNIISDWLLSQVEVA